MLKKRDDEINNEIELNPSFDDVPDSRDHLDDLDDWLGEDEPVFNSQPEVEGIANSTAENSFLFENPAENLVDDPPKKGRRVKKDKAPKEPKEKKEKKRRRKQKTNKKLIRVDEIQKVLDETGEEIDPNTVISMYMPKRRMARLGTALLRMDKLRLIALGLVVLVGGLFLISMLQEKMGNFTINLDRLEMYQKGINIDTNGNFTNPTSKLKADSIKNANNISIADLPANLNDIDGSHNGNSYMAFTFYMRNAGKETVNYSATIKLVNAAKGAENAVRVGVYRNGEQTVYAEPATNGTAENGTVKFVDHDLCCQYDIQDFEVGYVDKYTVVIWLEGDDPECVDAIIGGGIQFQMDINALDAEEKSTFQRLITDIKNTITGNNTISVSGTTAPSEIDGSSITWNNRRNQ